MLSRYVDAWHVMNVAVAPERRRQGIASALLQRLLELTKDDPLRGYTLEVRVSNTGAIALYERFGFPKGLRRGYYTDNREDALIMWRDAEPSTRSGRAACATRPRHRDVLRRDCRRRRRRRRHLLSSVVASQADLHARYGGVVPEIASRRHLELVAPVIRAALEEAGVELGDIGRIGVTQGPGLVGALLVGLSAAKALAWAGGSRSSRSTIFGATSRRSISHPTRSSRPSPACSRAAATRWCSVRDRTRIRVLGSTLDDAAGEAFDKGARLLGLGYPGGAEIDRLAREGDPEAFSFPVARVPGHDLSFSGLKTALLYAVRDLSEAELAVRRADLAASYQRAIVRALVGRSRCRPRGRGGTIAVVGGVSANSELRAALPDAHFVPLSLCTDNAAMIASAARFARSIESPGYLGLDAYASV